MQQQCQQCGYVSDRPTRFCRQCGAQLFVENEATSATTRQYVPQQPANSPANPYDAPYQSQLAQAQSGQDRRFDNQTPDTSRLHHAPIAQNYPNYPANYQQAEAKKSSAWKWVLITLLCIVLVSGGIGAMVILAIRANRAAEEARSAAEEGDATVPLPPALPLPPAIPLPPAPPLPPAIPLPPAPPLPPTAPGELPAGLEQYKYPNAEVKSSGSILGSEVAEMITSDNVGKVRDYYQKQLGDPMFKSKDGDSEIVMFQTRGSSTIVITVSRDRNSDETQINMVRSGFPIPKMN